MKQYLGAIVVLIGFLFLVLHAFIGGNWTLFTGLGIEFAGMIAHIIVNKQKKY